MFDPEKPCDLCGEPSEQICHLCGKIFCYGCIVLVVPKTNFLPSYRCRRCAASLVLSGLGEVMS